MRRFACPVCLVLGLAACGESAVNEPDLPADTLPAGPLALALTEVASGLSSPVFLTAPAGDDRLFVVEQGGRVRVLPVGGGPMTTFLDISARVRSGGEQGLLSIAFHPDYATNGFLYASYTDLNGDSRIERYRVTADPDVADPASATAVMSVSQPFSNHNGGLMRFGPDGMLYVGLGDGGSADDPQGHGQNRATLLGAMLRIDVDGGVPFVVPADNPFVSDPAARDEIWAFGLRNPWRWAFDPTDGLLYVADVGQDQWEEINVVPADLGGLNYGWNTAEGDHCFLAAGCDRSGFVTPAVEYDHGQGCSVTGGDVYRGDGIPELRGHYFYSDFCAGWIRSFRFAGGAATEQREWDLPDVGNVLSFGIDGRRELYVLAGAGRVFRLVRQ